ncbi:MAG: arginine--tRNA ligase, partial [Alloprevotella sp.]
MNLEKQLTEAVIKAVKAVYDADITPEQVSLQKTRPDFEGHLTLVTFPLLRISKRKPEDTGEDIALWLVENT